MTTNLRADTPCFDLGSVRVNLFFLLSGTAAATTVSEVVPQSFVPRGFERS